MNFITPANFAWTALAGLIALLYMLRLKRREKIVSSTLLWASAVRDLQANAPWKKLRSSLLMWLQIAFVLLAAAALARPSIKVFSGGGQTVAIILDASASMKATDVSPSRFDRARAEALRLINTLSSEDGAMVIGAASQTRLLAPLSTDRRRLQSALRSAAAEDTGGNLRDAILLAASLLRDRNNAQIYVLSDGATAPLEELNTGKAGLQFVKVGSRNENLAMTALDVRRAYARGSRHQIFATVRNYGSQSRTINLELARNGELAAVRPVTIAAGGRHSELFETSFVDGLFSVGFQEKDDLASDNIAYATLETPRNIRVLLVSSGNLFLEKALNVDPQVQLFRTSAQAFATTPPQGAWDVVVCDGEAPPKLPAANQLLFNVSTALSPVETTEAAAQRPSVVDWDRRHPVTRFAPWNDINFAEAQQASVKPWAQALVEAERTPLVAAGERGGRRVIWCGFDLARTDLPLRVTFPIFVTNALQWLVAPRGGPGGGAQGGGAQGGALPGAGGRALRTGEAVALDAPAGAGRVTVTGPGDVSRQVSVTATPLLYDGAREAGVYTAAAGGWKRTFAVSLLDSAESDLQPRDALKVQDGQLVQAESRARANRELWAYVVVAALLLLGLEWWLYHRGA